MNHTVKILLAICMLFIQAIANITNNTQWHNNQLNNPKDTNYPNTINSQTLTPQSWYASQSPQSISILESNIYNASLVKQEDRDNLNPAIILPPIIGAYKAYKFAQGLNKSKDIISKANPQNDESKNSNASNKNDKNQTNDAKQNKKQSNSGKFKDSKEADSKAKELGYKEDKEAGLSHGQKIYKHPKKNSYITRDVDSHSGGAWKEADSPKNVGNKNSRSGTYDKDLNKIGK